MRKLAVMAVFLTSAATAQEFQGDWGIDGLSYEGNVYNALSLDLQVLPRYISANGIISHANGLLFRPIDGTCVLESTGGVSCVLTLDALTITARFDTSPEGSVELTDTQTQVTVSTGTLNLISLK